AVELRHHALREIAIVEGDLHRPRSGSGHLDGSLAVRGMVRHPKLQPMGRSRADVDAVKTAGPPLGAASEAHADGALGRVEYGAIGARGPHPPREARAEPPREEDEAGR